MKKIYIFLPLLILLGSLTGCDDYLDLAPDTRTEIDSPEKVAKLLVSAYPKRSPASILEMLSDNTDENLGSYAASSFFYEECYQYKAQMTNDDNDAPYYFWSNMFMSIATANTALEAIEEMGNPESLRAERGEALLCRAFTFFLLSNVYCQAYGENSGTDLGLPYITSPETTVNPQYSRGTMDQLYENIEKDLLEGLPLLDDSKYTVPKYHFTTQAANAFAARFYLYYGKYDEAIKYADRVLGDNPSSVLRNWVDWGKLIGNGQLPADVYNDVANPANLLNICVPSAWGSVAGPSTGASKYFHNSTISKNETLESRGPWGRSNVINDTETFYLSTWSSTQSSPKIVVRKFVTYLLKSHPTALSGYPYYVHPILTTDEVLVNRAEAYALKGGNDNYNKAINDMRTLLTKFSSISLDSITLDKVDNYYANIPYSQAFTASPKKEFHPYAKNMVINSGTQENLLHFILHIKRIMTMHEGTRMMDLKRYGIKIYRRQVDQSEYVVALTDSILPGDGRRALQVPREAIGAGLEPNPGYAD